MRKNAAAPQGPPQAHSPPASAKQRASRNAYRGRTLSANGDAVFGLDGYAVFAKMSERSAHLAELQGMGFLPAACERALQLTNNSLDRAIDWLLSNPAGAASVASASDSQSTIFSMGFEESLVRRALEQAGGNEERAVALILSSQVRESPSREPSPAPSRPGPSAPQPFVEHTGEFRRSSARPPVRVGRDGSVLGEIEHYCSTQSVREREGMPCTHQSLGSIRSDHWSCKHSLRVL